MNDSVSPSTLEKEANKAYRQNRLEEAIQSFAAAREAYNQAGDTLKSAEMANNLSVALLNADRAEESLQAVEGTPEIFLEAGDEFRAAMAFGNLASALEACDDIEEAEAALQRAIEIFRDLGENENLLYTTQALSQLQLRQGRAMEALSTMQGGLENQSKLSPKHRILRSLLDIPSRFLGR